MTDKAINDFLYYVQAGDRQSSARAMGISLRCLEEFLLNEQKQILHVTLNDLLDFRVYLASPSAIKNRRQVMGGQLSRATQASRLHHVRTFYKWLYERSYIALNPAANLKVAHYKKRTIQKDFLTQQEAQAFLETAFEQLESQYPVKNRYWARAYRNVAMVVLALASGRRCHGVCSMPMQNVDLRECEVRVDWEKGQPGRVLPIADWAAAILGDYMKIARPMITRPDQEAFLFPGLRALHIDVRAFFEYVRELHNLTVKTNPDLTDLARKKITTHSLRVSFAKLLFSNGCSIRSVNELMLHRSLNTTAAYTPLSLQELATTLRHSHPRA